MNQINNDIYLMFDLLPLDMHGWNGNSGVFREFIEEINCVASNRQAIFNEIFDKYFI